MTEAPKPLIFRSVQSTQLVFSLLIIILYHLKLFVTIRYLLTGVRGASITVFENNESGLLAFALKWLVALYWSKTFIHRYKNRIMRFSGSWKLAEYDSILLIIKLIIGVIVVVGITYYVLRPLLKGLSGIEERVARSRPALNRRALEDEELQIPTSKPAEITKREIIKKALEDPIRTTQLVRNWLREKK